MSAATCRTRNAGCSEPWSADLRAPRSWSSRSSACCGHGCCPRRLPEAFGLDVEERQAAAAELGDQAALLGTRLGLAREPFAHQHEGQALLVCVQLADPDVERAQVRQPDPPGPLRGEPQARSAHVLQVTAHRRACLSHVAHGAYFARVGERVESEASTPARGVVTDEEGE